LKKEKTAKACSDTLFNRKLDGISHRCLWQRSIRRYSGGCKLGSVALCG
jgi:hypothetical protein